MAVSHHSPSAAFPHLGRTTARAVLVAAMLTTIGAAAWAPAPDRLLDVERTEDGTRYQARGPRGDVALHRATLARTVQGQGYYDAVEAELRLRRYPTSSIFNWRTPLPIWAMAQTPSPGWGAAILAAIALGVVALGYGLLGAEGGTANAVWGACVLLTGVVPCLLSSLAVMSELWAGALIGLSVICYGRRWPAAGQAAAAAALFFRELAAPYYVVCMAFAVRDRHWREAGLLTVGLLAYAVFYAAHVREVLPHIRPGDPGHAGSWVAFGGLPFVLATVRMNGLLVVLPIALSAAYLVAAALGFAGWTSPAGLRAGVTAGAYVAAFALVGQPFNQYWGSLIAPLLCLGVARCPLSLRALWQRARS